MLTSLVCGIAPAIHSSRRDLATTMRAAGRGVAGSALQARLGKGFVIAQVALSLMLLVGASLLIRTLIAVEHVDLGYPPDRILVMRVPLVPTHYPDAARRITFFKDLVQRLQAVPGVKAVGLNTGLHPFGNMGTAAEVAGAPPNPDMVPGPSDQPRVSRGARASGCRPAACSRMRISTASRRSRSSTSDSSRCACRIARRSARWFACRD